MKFEIKETKTTPLIIISEGKILIKGRSIPEDSAGFYNPIIETCEQYVDESVKSTDIIIQLEYVNSGSKKFLTNILTVFEKSYLAGNKYQITWNYDEDDEAILELGNDLKSIVKIPITMTSIDD